MIKRTVFALALSGTCLSLQAQTIDDVLRFSTTSPAGTTRGQSVGGALGSLGGEVSSMYVNPAGVGFFRTNDFSVTAGLGIMNNQGTYLGTTDKDNKVAPNISNLTFIFGGNKKRPDSKWQNFSGGIGINRNQSFNERVYYTGTNNNSSLSLNYYLQADAAGITNPESQLGGNQTIGSLAHSSVLAFQTFLINPIYNNNVFTGKFYSAAEATDNSVHVRQENMLDTKGSSNDVSFAFAANYNDQLYLGFSGNIVSIDYEREKTWKETNVNAVAADLNFFSVTEYLKTDGTGLNGKLGVIYKPVRPLSLGVAFHTPSWIWLTDTYHTDMATSVKSVTGIGTASSTDTNDGFEDESRYKIRTPWKGIVSATYLFAPSADTRKPTGFITVDYEYQDYAAMTMGFRNGQGTDRDDSKLRNDAIKDTYQGASNIRIGGELKLHVIALRLGYANYGSPYKNSALEGGRQFYTGGLGYRNKGFYWDLGLVYGTGTRVDQPYVMEPNTVGYQDPAPAEIKNKTTNIITTVGWKF